MRKIVYSIILFPLVSLSVFGQSSLTKGTTQYNLLDYPSAISQLENHVAKKGTDNTAAVLMLADSYYNTMDYSKARYHYNTVYSKNPSLLSETDLVKYVNSLRIIGDHANADMIYVNYYGTSSERVKLYKYQKQNIDSMFFTVESLKSLGVNTTSGDLCPVIGKDGKVYFTSNRNLAKETYPGNNKPYMSLYESSWNENSNELNNVKEVKTNSDTKFNEATIAFGENNTIYFTKNYITKKGKLDAANGEISNLQILRGTLENGAINNVTPLEFNSKMFNCTHPYVFNEGKSMIFSSDMPGGYGGPDLYYVEIFNDGSTSAPLNLGPRINSAGREVFPTVFNDTLYYSTDGFYGFGGLDLFYSDISSIKSPTLPRNMGEPINSSKDDFHFIWTKKDELGMFSSNRIGGKGDDDIYGVQVVTAAKTIEYKGIVTSSPEGTKLEGVKIVARNEYNEVVAETKSKADGTYELLLPNASNLNVTFSKPEFSTEKVKVTTPKQGQPDDLNALLTSYQSLTTKSEIAGLDQIKVDPIYFEYDQSEITDQAEVELNKIVYAMEKFPTMIIKIESHTDSRGKDDYNLSLSDRRAKSTRDYIISKGIDADRIVSAIGYGETRLLNKCTNNAKCSENEHAVNRRSNFIVISK